MRYVIYNVETTLILKTGMNKADSHASMRLAKAALTRYIRRTPDTSRAAFAIADSDTFTKEIEKKEIRRGIVGAEGKTFEVPVNTPWTSGPWSETYWCQ